MQTQLRTPRWFSWCRLFPWSGSSGKCSRNTSVSTSLLAWAVIWTSLKRCHLLSWWRTMRSSSWRRRFWLTPCEMVQFTRCPCLVCCCMTSVTMPWRRTPMHRYSATTWEASWGRRTPCCHRLVKPVASINYWGPCSQCGAPLTVQYWLIVTLAHQVVGLTASVGVGKKTRTLEGAVNHILKLCAHLDVEELKTVEEHKRALDKRVVRPNEGGLWCTVSLGCTHAHSIHLLNNNIQERHVCDLDLLDLKKKYSGYVVDKGLTDEGHGHDLLWQMKVMDLTCYSNMSSDWLQLIGKWPNASTNSI